MSDKTPSWLDAPGRRERLFQGLIGACVLLLGLDILDLYQTPPHPGFDFLDMPGFHAILGFGATIALVQGAYALRDRLSRGEDYYDEREDAHHG